MSEPKPWPDYSFLERAAAEAREASRRYWAKGGVADRKWPQQPVPGWPVDGSEPVGPLVPQPKTRRGKLK
jgi:hypothetical protein